ncbi:hypothetical protein COCON_G00100670 [Conger conger]|uniref:Uncharacterized protein n=1 Tax=Conger conger TaxID=82655 RepID=A0A9Q1DIC2_CONCO|nr:hypothetical protein COCON_G00100670 [Conger conger]
MTSPSLPAPGQAPLRPPAGQLPCATMPSEGSDDYFSLSSSAAPGLAGVSPTKRAAAPADVAMETANCGTGQLAVRTVALSDDVTAAPPMGCASALAALAPGPGYAARVRPGFIPPAESHSPADTGSRGGAVLGARRGAARTCAGDKPGKRRQRGSRSLGGSHALLPGPIEDGKVGRMRSSRMRGRGRGQGRGRAGTLQARQRDCRISIKIRLRRQCKGHLWEIVSRREEGVASTPRGGNSVGRGRGLRHRQNLPTLGRIIRSKDGLPVVKRPRRLSRAPPLPQRIFSALTLSPPSALSSPPTLTPLSPPHKPVPLLQTSPARASAQAVPLPPAPPIAEDSDEQIGKLLDDIMMGLNILPPIIVERDAGRNLEPSGACAYPCPRTPEPPRPGSGLSCPRTQDGSPPINHQSGYNGSQETTFPRLTQQASDEMCMLDHFLWSRDSHVGGAWERSAPGPGDGGGAVPAGDQTGAGRHGHDSYSFAPQPGVAPATGTMRQGGPAAPARRTAVTLGPGQASSLSPWTELRIPQFLSPPPPITPSLDELRLPARLSPLGMEAAPPKNAAGSSALPKIPTAPPPPASGPRPPQPLPSWLCPFPVPLHDLPTPLHCALQVPSCPCPPQSQRGPRCSRKGAAERRRTRAEEEEGTSMRKTATRGPSLEDRRRRKGWKEEEGKKPKPAAPCRTMQKMGPRSIGRGRGGRGRGRARRAPTVSSASLNPNMNPNMNPSMNPGRAGVCAAKLRNGCVRKTRRPAGCAGNPRQTDCADELKRSAIGANRADRSTVCADNVQKPSVCADGVKQEGVCLTVKPPLTCANGQQRAATSPRPEPPPKRGRGRPRKRPIEKEATGGPTSILAPDGSGGPMGEHGHKPASKRRRITMPSRLETSLRTQRSRACWEREPGTPSAIAQLSSIHGEEQRIHGEEEMAQGDGERREEEIKRIGGLMEGMVIVQLGEIGLDGVMEMEERRDVMVDPEPQKNSTDPSQAGGTPHTQQPSCTGSQRRDLTAATTWNQTVDRSAGSWDQDEEEVEVDVLACSSPAPPAVSLLLEITGAGLCGTGAGLCIRGAGLCDTGPSEEEEGEVDVIGEAD